MPTKSRKKPAPKRRKSAKKSAKKSASRTRKSAVKRSSYGSRVPDRGDGLMKVQYSGGYQPGKSLRQLQTKNGGSHRGRSQFGALDVPNGMRSVSSYRRAGTYNRPFLMMPYGPPQRWLEQTNGQQGPASSKPPNSKGAGNPLGGSPRGRRPGSNYGSSRSLKGKYVNPSGYLSTWYGQPRTPPPSWNPLLLQGQNTFRQGINSPRLSNVVVPRRNSFGRGRFRY